MAVLVSVGLSTFYANGRRLVRLSDGTLYCVYFKMGVSRWQIYVKKSTDDGATWTDETRISTYAGMDGYHQMVPSIAIDSSDNLHVVWQGKATGFTSQNQIWYNKYTGGAWAGPVRISDFAGMSTKGQRYPSIAVDSSDNLHVVWDGMATGFITDYQIWYNKYSGAWAGPVRISDYAGMELYEQAQAGIAIDSNGYLHVVWHGKATGFTTQFQIWYNKYSGAWAGPVRISDYAGMTGQPNGSSSIAVDSNDYIHVVWQGKAVGFHVHTWIWYNKYDGAWAGPVRISTYDGMGVTFDQYYPSVAVDAFNAVHVLWYGKATGYGGTNRVWYAKYVTSWDTPECLQTMGTDLSHPNLRWSRYPPSNIPYAGVDYVFFEVGGNIYWDKKDNPFVAASTVTTNQATAVEATAAIPNGTLEDDGGEACDCGFEWGETIAYGNITPTQSRTTGQTFSQIISGLDPNKTYHFKAFATNIAGTSHGADRTFTTLVAIPTVPTDEATDVKETSATLNGTLDDDGGEACECRFQYGLTTDYGTNTAWQAGKETGDTFSQAIVELVGGNLYHFRAQAKNSAGTANGNDRTLATIIPFVAKRTYALSREEL